MKKNKQAIMTLCVLFLALPAVAGQMETPEDKILSKGFDAYMDGRNRVAQSYFEEVIRLNPKNKAAEMALEKVKIRLKKKESKERAKAKKLSIVKVKEGRELLKTNNIVAAVDAFHAAIDADPKNKKAKSYMNRIQKKMKKILKRKKFNLSDWAFARGVMAYLDRDWSKAYRIWSDRSSLEPQNLALSDAKARAEDKFVKMMVKEKDDFLRRGAREFYRQGMYQEAKRSWTQILNTQEEDQEALEGKARAENALLALKGKDRNKKAHDLLERALEYYASQEWKKARDSFKKLVQLDSSFTSAKEYLSKINHKLSAEQYIPAASPQVDKSWRENRPSNQGKNQIQMPGTLENLEERRAELESQLKRNPSDIRIQQELDKMKKMQEEESERIYKDGLIAYSQGNRMAAINKWKQVLVLNPEHKKAAAALRKARAEEERTTEERTQ